MFSELYRYYLSLLSFPTRRSSDLPSTSSYSAAKLQLNAFATGPPTCDLISCASDSNPSVRPRSSRTSAVLRSEEHTSELQSLRHLVCRLLLEKKKIYIKELVYDII